MNKIFLSKLRNVLLIFICFFGIAVKGFANDSAPGLDASQLTNNLSRSVNLSNLFFGRFVDYLNTFYYDEGAEDDYEPALIDASLNAIWYSGFGINTDYGTQSGSLARGYSDILLGFNIGDIIIGGGTGGIYNGVFLDNITFNVPSYDPVTDIQVSDLMGNQVMNDIYALALGINGYFWGSTYFLTNKIYQPDESGVLNDNAELSLGFWGLKLQTMNCFFADLLFSGTGEIQQFEWAVDPFVLALLCFNIYSDGKVSVRGGVNWDSISKYVIGNAYSGFDWKSFLIPLSYSQTFGDKYKYFLVNAGTNLAVGDFYRVSDSVLASADLGAKLYYSWESVTKKGETYRQAILLGGKGSYYSNIYLSEYGDSDKYRLLGWELSAGYVYDDYLTIEAVWRRNFYSDLMDLFESKDKDVFGVNAAFKLPKSLFRRNKKSE